MWRAKSEAVCCICSVVVATEGHTYVNIHVSGVFITSPDSRSMTSLPL